VDAVGLLRAVVITAASVRDRGAARPLLWNLHRACRRIRLIWADAVCTGKLTGWAATVTVTLRVVARRQAHAFEVLPRRRVADRTFAWISKAPPRRPRRRTPPGRRRSHDVAGHDRCHGPPPGPARPPVGH